MKINLLKKLILLGAMALLLGAASFQAWEKTPAAPGANPWNALLVHPREDAKVLAASQNAIYETTPPAKGSWKKWASLPSPSLEIQKLRYFPEQPDSVFILTDKRLYKASLKDSKQELIYELSRMQQRITDFAMDPLDSERWFLGTTAGVLESRDSGKKWHLLTPAGKESVCFVRFAAEKLFVAHPDHLMASENLSRFEKVFSFSPNEDISETGENSIPNDFEETVFEECRLFEMTSNPQESALWLATSRGVYEAEGSDISWSPLSLGLLSNNIHYLIYDSKTNQLFAASLKQVFKYRLEENRWQEIPLPLAGASIKGLSAHEDKLHIITSSGLLTHLLLPDHIAVPEQVEISFGQKFLFQDLVRLEPNALQIQHAVIRYANAQNSKTKRWQAESRLRAFFPTVSYKKDLSTGNNIDLDRGGTSDPDKFIQGPADISRGWDFGVSWDLGDFIFSSNQTSIDSREKLMMELRHDFTQEATRLYYERRRLQMETVFEPGASEQEHLEKILQIEEVTALLDSMTNGFLSKALEGIYEKHPELEALWTYRGNEKHEWVTNEHENSSSRA